ncbi:MAG: hypothetical protein EZS28_008689 [Streblomastix strix]|uniref:Reverse transcriptase domain-containing protein n=1 Tax=Streblomastix strix TaxID=222440 RepID=A0A5J4WLF5_9EUKA|nr:MAG: hypothetical protein EZS28_008689 [Streblomastix strix]
METNSNGLTQSLQFQRKEKRDGEKLWTAINLSLIFNAFVLRWMLSKHLRELIRPADQKINLDLESTFNHITVEPNFRPFLGFEFKRRFYMYTAMCFGVLHAPLIFHKTMKPLMKYVREKMSIRSKSYCDDLIFMNENKEVLAHQVLQIVQIIQEFGWQISQKKSSLILIQSSEFLGWSANSLNNELTIISQRKGEMLKGFLNGDG